MAGYGYGFTFSLFFIFFVMISALLIDSSCHLHHNLYQPANLHFPSKLLHGDGSVGRGTIISIRHCYTCGYSERAMVLKDMLETYFPGIDVNIKYQIPNLQNRALGLALRFGAVAICVVVERIRHPLRMIIVRSVVNRAHIQFWLERTSFLQLTEAFEVYFGDVLIFSKSKEQRFPTAYELREIVARKLVASGVDGRVAGFLWS